MGRQHQGMDGPGVRQVPEGSGEQGKMEKTGCKIICGAPTTLAVKGLMMMMSDVCRSSNLEQTSVKKSEHTNQLFKVLTKISQVDLFLTLVCSSHWKQQFVGQPPSDCFGAGCVNDDSCLQQGCSRRDLHI